MTVKEFISKTPDSYMELSISEYSGDDLVRRIICKKHEWHSTYIPESVLNNEVIMIVPYYSRISLVVDAKSNASKMETIANIEDINLEDCFFSKNECGEKFVTLSFHHRHFDHRYFKRDRRGDYITFKGKKYYYPYNGYRFLI